MMCLAHSWPSFSQETQAFLVIVGTKASPLSARLHFLTGFLSALRSGENPVRTVGPSPLPCKSSGHPYLAWICAGFWQRRDMDNSSLTPIRLQANRPGYRGLPLNRNEAPLKAHGPMPAKKLKSTIGD